MTDANRRTCFQLPIGVAQPCQRLVEDDEPAAIRVKDGVAAIFTSTSLRGFSVQAWVT